MVSNHWRPPGSAALSLWSFKTPEWVALFIFLLATLLPFSYSSPIDKSQHLSPASMNLMKSGQHQLPGSNLNSPANSVHQTFAFCPERHSDYRSLSVLKAFWGFKKPLFLRDGSHRGKTVATHLKPTKTPRACVLNVYFYSLYSSRRERDLNFRVERDAAWEM